VLRGDVATAHRDAPVCAGFNGTFMPREGYARPLDGVYRFILVNVVGDVYGSRMTNIAVTFDNGAILSAEYVDLHTENVARGERLLAGKVVS